jgi:tRNA uridine 5-carboxymethylaminomethyl modification enzyme
MFTSRAEFRLSLRADNADQRLTPRGLAVGCIGAARHRAFAAKMAALAAGRELAGSASLTPTEAVRAGIEVNQDGVRRSALDLLAQPGQSLVALARIWPELGFLPAPIARQIECDALYARFEARQGRDIAAIRRDEALEIPDGFDYRLAGLSAELQARLSRMQPDSLGRASRIEGMTPAALALILTHLHRQRRRSA